MKRISNYFLQGLLVFVPLALTVFVVSWLLGLMGGLFNKMLPESAEKLGPIIPLAGLVVTLAVITLIGFLTSNILGRKLFELIDKLINHVPFIKLLYSSLKDFIGAFAGEKKSFDKPVLVELTVSGPMALGFITRENLDNLGLAGHVAVYFPQSYNFAGSVLIFPAEKVKPVKIDSSKAMAFIVSGGVAGTTE